MSILKKIVGVALISLLLLPQMTQTAQADTWPGENGLIGYAYFDPLAEGGQVVGTEIINPETGEYVRASAVPTNVNEVQQDWSKDGKTLAAVQQVIDITLSPAIVVMDPDGSHRRTILQLDPDQMINDLSWISNTQMAVLIWNGEHNVVRIINASDGSTATTMPIAEGSFDNYLSINVSPDGKQLLATTFTGGDIYNIATGALVRSIPDESTPDSIYQLYLQKWWPDGKSVVGTGYSDPVGGSTKVVRVDVQTGAMTTMPGLGQFGDAIAISPDGKKIAGSLSDPDNPTFSILAVANIDGSDFQTYRTMTSYSFGYRHLSWQAIPDDSVPPVGQPGTPATPGSTEQLPATGESQNRLTILALTLISLATLGFVGLRIYNFTRR